MLMLAAMAGAMVAGVARAQVPAAGAGAGAAAAGAGAAPPAAAGAAGAAAKPGFLEKACTALDKKIRKMCSRPSGQFLNKLTAPLTQLSGGIIPGFCPAMPSAADMAKPGAEGEAAALKADAVQAAARVAAVQYLGTLDCHWHPEAEAGLIKALRTDRNECVRLAAARALCRGCCCTKAVLEALEDCIGGKEKFGPYENSPRVQGVAMVALEHCLSCYHEVSDAEDDQQKGKSEKGPGEAAPPPADVTPGSAKPVVPVVPPPPQPATPPTVSKSSGKPTREQIERARQTLAVAKAKAANQESSAQSAAFPSGQRSLMNLANFVIDGKATVPAESNGPIVSTMQPQLATTAPAAMPQSVTQAPAAPLVSPYVAKPGSTLVPPPAMPATPSSSPYVGQSVMPPPAPKPVTPVLKNNPYGAPSTSVPVSVQVPAAVPVSVRVPAAAPLSVQPPAPNNITPAAASMSTQSKSMGMDPTPTVVHSAYRPTPLPMAVESAKSKPVDPTILRCLETLRDAGDPEVRHTAVKTLAACNWHDHPEAVLGLVYSARHDKHAGMRVACVRSLASMKACTPEVMTGLKPMTADKDEWIRQETTQALAYLQTFMPKGEETAGWQGNAIKK